jgi:hypothetical protein
MRKMFVALLSSIAFASFTNDVFAAAPPIGGVVDIGVPDGIAVGVVAKPYINWARLNVSATYNGMAPGVRGGLTLDPIKFPIGLSLTGEVGHSFEGKLPSFDMPSLSYTYENLHLGLEMGNRDSVRFFIHAGPTWMQATSGNLQSFVSPSDKSIHFSNPDVSLRVMPTAKLGIVFFF